MQLENRLIALTLTALKTLRVGKRFLTEIPPKCALNLLYFKIIFGVVAHG